MDAKTKAMLADHKVKKRERTCLLKDLHPTDLLILIDRAEEAGQICDPIKSADRLAYLSRASPEQIQALASRLPYAWTFLRGYPRGRFVVLFAESHLISVLSFVLTNPRKYIKVPRAPRCGLDELQRGLFDNCGFCECDPRSDELCLHCANFLRDHCKGKECS